VPNPTIVNLLVCVPYTLPLLSLVPMLSNQSQLFLMFFFYFPYIIFDQLLISPYKKFMIGCFNKFKFTGGLAWTCIWIYLFMVRMYLNLFKDMFEFDEDVLNLCMDLFDFKLIIIITKLVWLLLWVDVYIININRSFKNKGFKLLLCDNLFSFAPASLFLGEII